MVKVKVRIRNRRAYFIGDNYPKEILQPFFQFKPDNYRFMALYRRMREDPATGEMVHVWDGNVNLLKRQMVGTGLFLMMKDQIEKETPIRFKVIDKRKPARFKDIELDEDRQYQTEALQAMIDSVSGGIVLGATGTGKTRLAALFFLLLDGYGVFIVDELTLMDQAKEEIEQVIGEEVGEIGDSKFNPKRITVATIQTLHLHSGEKLTLLEKRKGYKPSKHKAAYKEWSAKLKAILIDELHVMLNKRNFTTVEAILPKIVIGLTATLELQKKRIRMLAHNLCGPVLYEYPLSRGTKEGYLTPGIAVSVPVWQMDHEDDEYADAYKALIVNSDVRNKLITDLVTEGHKRGRSIILLCERVAHLRRLSSRLKDISHKRVYGAKSKELRNKAKKKFDKGKIRLIITNKVFKKGVNIKAVDMIIDAAGMKNKNDAIQKYGRGVRLFKGKTGLLYFDMSDKSMEGVTKEDPEYNRFTRATASRLNALKSKGITVVKIEPIQMAFGPKRIMDIAEKELAKEVEKIEKLRQKNDRRKAGKRTK